MKAKFLGVEVEYDSAIFMPSRYPKRKQGQCCGVCDCYIGGRCSWGFKLERKPGDWCFQFGSRKAMAKNEDYHGASDGCGKEED